MLRTYLANYRYIKTFRQEFFRCNLDNIANAQSFHGSTGYSSFTSHQYLKAGNELDQSQAGPHFVEVMTLVCRFKLKLVCLYTPGSKSIISANNSGMTSKSNNTLSFFSCKVFIINKPDFLFRHLPEHLTIVRLFFCYMCKEQICFSRYKGPFINLFNPKKNITFLQILL